MECKIIEIPVADNRIAEQKLNAELAKIKGTFNSATKLDYRRIMVFYEPTASESTTTT